MGNRLELHQKLVDTLGSPNVYFQPPQTTIMKYPAIVYARSAGSTQFASNYPYAHAKRYAVTLIDKDPDNPVVEKLAAYPMCLYDRHYVVGNLNHDVYNIYF